MKRKIFSILFALVLVLSLSLVTAVPASAATLNVPSASYPTIQSAIDAANPGDTINVAAGTYTEQLLIQKSLTITGAGAGTTTIQAPAPPRAGSVVEGGSTWDYIIAAYPSSGTIDVRIEGFTIDANSQVKTAGTAGLIGVFFRDVDGTNAGLYSCTIGNFGTTAYESWGIRVYGDSDLTIDDNTLSGYTRDGIVVNGDGGPGADPDVEITDNHLTGSATPLNGIQIAYGAIATIAGNTVEDHTRSSPWAAVGILVKESDGVTINSGNTVENCHYGLLLSQSDGCTVSGNTFTENVAYHITLDNSDGNTVSANTITGTASGSEDNGIGLANGATGNMINENIITMAAIPETFSPRKFIYLIYVQGSVGAGSNTIQNNYLYGGTRAIQIDGGNTGTTTIANNTIGNAGPSFAGIYLNGGNAVISGNTLTNTVRPIEFWGAIDVTITGNTINGSTFDGINCGLASGDITISGNEIFNIPNGPYTGMYAIHCRWGADDAVIDDNEIYNSERGIGIDSGCTGVEINNNYIHDNTYVAIEIHEAVDTITCNTLSLNKRGIETWSPITAHYNNILFHIYGGLILHGVSDGTDATNNWWGDASGPYVDYLLGTGTGTLIVTNGHSFNFEPWSFTPDPCEAKTLGFWKNHPDSTTVVFALGPPVLGTYNVPDASAAIVMLKSAKAKNAYDMLAAQLIAAELNKLHLDHLSIDSSCFDAPIAAADAFLIAQSYTGPGFAKPSKADKQTANGLKDALDLVNNNGCGGCLCEWD